MSRRLDDPGPGVKADRHTVAKTRLVLAETVADDVQKRWPDAKVVRRFEAQRSIPVLLIEIPGGDRHHVRFIDVAGYENDAFEDANSQGQPQ